MAKKTITHTLRALYELAHEEHGCTLVRVQVTADTPDWTVELEFVIPKHGKVLRYLVEDFEWDRPKHVIDYISKSLRKKLTL